MWGSVDHYFGVSSEQLQGQAAPSRNVAGQAPTGSPGTYASFTDWRRSPVFWLAVFSVLALGMIHLEGAVGARIGR